MSDVMSDVMSDENLSESKRKATLRNKIILNHLKNNNYITNADVRRLCDVSAATANRILAKLSADGYIVKTHFGKLWAYELSK